MLTLTDNQKALISGATAGAVGFTLTLPVDYVKQHLQSGSSLANIRTSVSNRGVGVLFRGGMVGLGSIVPQMAIKYYGFNYLVGEGVSRPFSGLCAGLMDGAFLGPVLAMQSLKQMDMGKNLVKKNIMPLMVPMALRNGTFTGVILGNYGYLRKFIYGDREVRFVENFMMGSMLNIPATILCSPFDVIRANHISNLGKKGLKDVVREIWVRDGWRGFYRGYGSLYLNFAMRFPLTLALQFEIVKKL